MSDWIEQLERLTQLHKSGVLTDEEFAVQKARILAQTEAPAAVEAASAAGPVSAPVEEAPAQPQWDPVPYDDGRRGQAVKYALIGVPAALVLAGAAYFGATLIGGDKTDPELAGAAPTTAASSDAAVASAAPSEDARLPAALDGSLAFSSPSNCTAGKTLEAVYKKLDSAAELGSGKGITVRLDAFDNPLALEVKNKTDADGIETKHAWLRFPEGTTWHGLKLSRVTTTTTIVPESDGGYERTITFLDEPDKVRATLARLGFGAPRAPDYAELSDDACGGSMQIVAVSGGSALMCNWGC